jgi:multicomponent Na+:H+ antiporter subunit G
VITALLPWLADALVLLGTITTAIAVYGLIRLPDVYTRLHAASKVAVLGTIPIVLASVVTAGPAALAHAILIAAFLVLTTPVAAHAIARAAYQQGVPASIAEPDGADDPSEPRRQAVQ